MNSAHIQELVNLLHKSQSPETLHFVQRRLREMGMTLTDLYQQLEMTDPFLDIYMEQDVSGISSPIHAHPFMEILYCHSNSDAACLVDDRRYILQRGDIVVIPPGVPHSVSTPPDSQNPYTGYTLWLSVKYLETLAELFPFFVAEQLAPEYHLRTAGTVWEYLGELFRGLYLEKTMAHPGWESALSGISTVLLTQIARMLKQKSQQAAPPSKEDLLEQVLVYLNSNLSQKITLDDIASRFWVSSSTISHLFTKSLGISFYKYVTQRRLTEAKNLIREDLPMEQVALKVGFGDYSAFYRAFRQEYHCSPREYQKIVAAKK